MSKPERPYHRREIGDRQLRPESLAMTYGYDPQLSEGAIKPPIFQTSTFAFRSAEQGAAYFRMSLGKGMEGFSDDPGLAYTRINNPDLEVLEDRLTLYDGAEEALAFSSGMGAITTSLLTFMEQGSVVLHSTPLYGATEAFIRSLLPKFGAKTEEFPAAADEAEMRAAFDRAAAKGEVSIIFTESPANPTNALVDLELCARLRDELAERQERKPVLMTDNTLLGPIGLTPIKHGADLTLYSLTKYIGGHSDLVAGGAMGASSVISKIRSLRTQLGTNPDPHTCWLLMRSLETVKLRMERAFDNAQACAAFLANHPKVEAVRHLGLLKPGDRGYEVYMRQCTGCGSTFSFDMKGGQEAAFRLLNALKLIKLAVSLGGNESLMCHPGTTTHSVMPDELRARLGFTPGLVRFSVGIEDPDDLIADLTQALEAA